jgi:hypothetical protein
MLAGSARASSPAWTPRCATRAASASSPSTQERRRAQRDDANAHAEPRRSTARLARPSHSQRRPRDATRPWRSNNKPRGDLAKVPANCLAAKVQREGTHVRARTRRKRGYPGEPKWEPTFADTEQFPPTSGDARQRGFLPELAKKDRQHIRKIAVGMAGFEPAASCSQISPRQMLTVAHCRPAGHLRAVMFACCRLTSPGVCAHWLPLWLHYQASNGCLRLSRTVYRNFTPSAERA